MKIEILIKYTGKKSRFFKVFKVTGNKCITAVSQNSKKRVNKEVKMTMVDFQQQSPQWLVNRYEHMNSQNEQWMMQLKAIQKEYYNIEN